MAVRLEGFTERRNAICQRPFHVLFTRFIFIYLWQRRLSETSSNFDVSSISAALGSYWRWAWVELGSFPALAHCLPLWQSPRSPGGITRNLQTSGSEKNRVDPAQPQLSSSGGGGGGDTHPSEVPLQPQLFTWQSQGGSGGPSLRDGRLSDAEGTLAPRDTVCANKPSRAGSWEGCLAGGLTKTKPARQAEHAPSNIIRPVTAVCVCHIELWNQEGALLCAYIIQPQSFSGCFSWVYLKFRLEQKRRSSVRR